DIFSLSQLCTPINGGSHWVLAAIDFTGEQFVILIRSRPDSPTKRSSMSWPQSCSTRRRTGSRRRRTSARPVAWLAPRSPEVPQQEGCDDCGVSTLMFARCLSRGEPLPFSMEHVQFLRRR
ncbi:unnamed protein product, partial [Phaeothamnion confervicola]